MLNRLLALELGNDKGLRSSKNLIKLLYTYIIPNITAIIAASTLGAQRFYDSQQMLLFMLGFNLFVTIIIQYAAQRGLFKNLEKEALLKFIPMKTPTFIKVRLFFLIAKFYFPVLLFSFIFLSYFVRGDYFVLIMIFLLSIIFIVHFQIYLAMIIRYCVNTFKPLYLQILQVSLFLLFIAYLSLCYLFWGKLMLKILENIAYNVEYVLFSIKPLPVFVIIVIIAVISVGFMFISGRVNINLLIHNRNLSLNINTAKLERLHERIYSFRLSSVQKLLFRKDIRDIFRNNKVMIVLIGLLHVISLGMLTFFFLDMPETMEAGVFMSKFYLAIVIGQAIMMGILSISFKDILYLENDINVVKSYHIKLPKEKLITAKTRVLRAFAFPKLTLIYAVLVITVLIMNQYILALLLLINFFECLLCIKTLELMRVKSVNKMNSENPILNIVNFILILLSFNMLAQLLNSTSDKLFLYQMLFLGSLIVLYCFHLFIFKNKKVTEGASSHAGN